MFSHVFWYLHGQLLTKSEKKTPENSRKMGNQMLNHSMHYTTFFGMILFLLLREIFSAEQFHKMYKEILHSSFIINYKWKLFNQDLKKGKRTDHVVSTHGKNLYSCSNSLDRLDNEKLCITYIYITNDTRKTHFRLKKGYI